MRSESVNYFFLPLPLAASVRSLAACLLRAMAAALRRLGFEVDERTDVFALGALLFTAAVAWLPLQEHATH